MRNTVPVAAVAASMLLCAGCGVAVEEPAAPGPSSAATSSTPHGTQLAVRVDLGPGKGLLSYSLTCDPAGGDHPEPAAACRSLRRLEDPFAPVPADAVCTQVYGGPQTASVTGTFEGQRVDARLSRTDGCQISRWDEHGALLVVEGGVGR